MNLALFDFDGTITFSDSFSPFVRLVARDRRALGTARLAPLIAGYKLGLVPAARLRAAAVRVGLRGRGADEVREVGASYGATLDAIVRPQAHARILWHQAQGDAVVVVSASLHPYLSAWCASRGLDLICSELEARDGVLTGRYLGADCSGDEKARRVRARYDLSRYPVVYAYGDTAEDEALLALAHRRYFCWRERGGVACAAAGG